MKIDVKKCPLCYEVNHCGNEETQSACWCSKESFPKEIFELIPKDQLHRSCICQNCLDQFKRSLKKQ
ncbi:cysteine-rich CWC family protein [Alkalihalobacterium chitinilyticum]|uniref:Cysteine-rich CWC family protein n=1 Tax=Alkalihalobacterium chitinilyticum TaxID=2980103 RepID=A0ABT5VDF7_9BACI|nr:cysteine-rich CWC family protein [Alkalihalobacterium chitinilyticum]MDE5413469.1 cysteine-rich CWC family protein [Alkalihalobacterium chitinilyticum]